MTISSDTARVITSSDHLDWARVHVTVSDEVVDSGAGESTVGGWHRIALVTRGRSLVEREADSGPDRALVGPGSLLLTTAGTAERTCWQSTSSEPLGTVRVALDPRVIDEAFLELCDRGAHGFPDVWQLEDAQVRTSVRDLVWALELGATPVFADALAAILAAKLVTVDLPASTYARASGLDAEVLARVVGFMDANLGEPITLDDLSAVANLSKHHLLRQFKVSTGLPPLRFLQRIRMERAERLLSAGNLTVVSVARVCGYASDRQFRAAFTRHVGTSPARWGLAQV